MTPNSDQTLNFRPATVDTLNLIRRFNADKRPVFLTSSNFIHAETAKLGYLLSFLLTNENNEVGPHRTFFLNSGLEALSGAVKLARQTSVRSRRDDLGRIVVVDEREKFIRFFDPNGAGSQGGLSPNIEFVTSLTAAQQKLETANLSALVLVRYSDVGLSRQLSNVLNAAHRNGAIVVACETELDISRPDFFRRGFVPDVAVYGENLAGYQVPFGCFVMSERAYSVWNNDVDCFAHASTFGGNSVCAAIALAELRRNGYISPTTDTVFAAIDSSRTSMIEYWGTYVNPRMVIVAKRFGIDLDVKSAWGGRLEFGDGREVIDCCGGFGSNLRGHNCSDIQTVLDQHNPTHDYFHDLEQLLSSFTKFPHALPAVSGATAVDLAVSLAMLANSPRRKIVTFVGNFSGKALFGLNLSKYGPQRTASDEDAFRPYYGNLIYVDPFADDAVATLTAVLRAGDVALVWFEVVRGLMCECLPPKIMSVLDDLKGEFGYLIGVDEILTGGWRASDRYLAHECLVNGTDIVAVGKTLSDMTLPIAAVLATEAVYGRAAATDAAHVRRLELHYRNQLSAHISVNALSTVVEQSGQERLARHEHLLQEGLRQVVSSSRVFNAVRGRGLLLRLQINPRYFPFRHPSAMRLLIEMSLSHLIFVRTGIFVFLLRFLHRVFTTESDIKELTQRLGQALHGVTPWMVYRYAFSRLIVQKFPRLASVLASGMRASVLGHTQIRKYGSSETN